MLQDSPQLVLKLLMCVLKTATYGSCSSCGDGNSGDRSSNSLGLLLLLQSCLGTHHSPGLHPTGCHGLAGHGAS